MSGRPGMLGNPGAAGVSDSGAGGVAAPPGTVTRSGAATVGVVPVTGGLVPQNSSAAPVPGGSVIVVHPQ